MNLNHKEHLFAENKIGQPRAPLWDWEMTRTIAAMYNSGGGILRVGVDDHGNPVGVKQPEAYAADKSPLTEVLHKFLDPVPPFEPLTKANHVEILIHEGVTSPSILHKEIAHPHDAKKKHAEGTVFIRRMNGPQPSSEPPQNRSDWQTVLHLWETNRGVTLQGPLVAQFCLIINKWNPFDRRNTQLTVWEALCIADVAETLEREQLQVRLRAIVNRMRPSSPPPAGSDVNQAGANYKKPFVDEVKRLCGDLGLLPRH